MPRGKGINTCKKKAPISEIHKQKISQARKVFEEAKKKKALNQKKESAKAGFNKLFCKTDKNENSTMKNDNPIDKSIDDESLCEKYLDPLPIDFDPLFDENKEHELETGVMQTYLQEIYKELRIETSRDSKGLAINWLIDFLVSYNWRIPSHRAKFICGKLEITFTEIAYYGDVEVWIPEIRFGLECMPKCPTCKSNKNVSFHAYRDNYFGRKIITLNTKCLI